MKTSTVLRSRPRHRRHARGVRGFLLFEVLVAILVFSFGVLAVVGLMSVAVKQTSGARNRAEATLLANELIGQMRVGPRTFAQLTANYDFTAPSADLAAWSAKVQGLLPNATQPVIAMVSIPGVAAGTQTTQVTITMSWQVPGEPVNSLAVMTRIQP